MYRCSFCPYETPDLSMLGSHTSGNHPEMFRAAMPWQPYSYFNDAIAGDLQAILMTYHDDKKDNVESVIRAIDKLYEVKNESRPDA